MSELERFCDRKGVKLLAREGQATKPCSWGSAARNWRCTLKYQGRQYTFNFYGGILLENPTAGDVLYTLLFDAASGELTFDDYLYEAGYDDPDLDSDNEFADHTELADHAKFWRMCERIADNIDRLLGDDLDQFQGLEH